MLPSNLKRLIAADGWLADHPANAGAQTERASPEQRVLVLSASKAAQRPASRQAAMISIRGAQDRELPLSSKYRGVLRLVFEDLSEVDDGHEADTISEAQAAAVARFVREHADARTLIVHCQMGVIRSRSLAAALCDIEHRPYSYTAVNDAVYRRVRTGLEREREAMLNQGQC